MAVVEIGMAHSDGNLVASMVTVEARLNCNIADWPVHWTGILINAFCRRRLNNQDTEIWYRDTEPVLQLPGISVSGILGRKVAFFIGALPIHQDRDL